MIYDDCPTIAKTNSQHETAVLASKPQDHDDMIFVEGCSEAPDILQL